MKNLRSAPKSAVIAVAAALLFSVSQSFAQSVSTGSAVAQAGGQAIIPVTFSASATPVSTIQFDLTFPVSLTYAATTTGAAALAAGKTASGNAVAGGARVLVFGLNQTAIGSGILATVRLNVAAGTPAGSITVGIANIAASDPSGYAVPVSGISGSVTVTAPPGDTTPPVISNVASSGITNTTATITWTTNEPADSQVEYGTATSYGSSTTLDTAKVTSHSTLLTGLTANTLYHYRVKSRDSAGNLAVSGDYTFRTGSGSDTTPPVISNVRVIASTPRSLTIAWDTNEPADSQIEYGMTTGYGSLSARDATLVTSHTYLLDPLSANTLYHYRVLSRDASGNLATSKDYAFITPDSPDKTPPVISNIVVTAVTSSMVRISWNTDERADSEIQYGTTPAFGNATPFRRDMTTSHSETILDLVPMTLYHFRVKSRDASGNLATADRTFTTPEGGGPTDTQRTFYCPRPIEALSDQYIGIALVNLDSKPATITFTACDRTGARIKGDGITNPATRSLDPGRQMPIVDAELFDAGLAAGGGPGWIKIESNVRNVVGFFMMFDGGLSLLDGATLDAEPATSFVFPEIEAEGFTRIAIDNPDTMTANLTIELVSGGGVPIASENRAVQGYASYSAELFQEIFAGIAAPAGAYVRVTSDRPVLSFQLTGKDGIYVNALKGQDAAAGATKLYCPQYAAGGPWRTSLSIVNLDPAPGTVTIRFVPEDPVLPGAAETVTIAPYGKILVDDPGFFRSLPPLEPNKILQGYVVITGEGVRLTGSVVFGDVGRSAFSSALPLVASLQNSLVFGHLASNDTYFTGLAMVNPNQVDVSATLSLYSAQGSLEDYVAVTIPAGGRLSKLLTEYFQQPAAQNLASGYIRVSANGGLASFALFGTHNQSVLSAIPAQSAP